MLCRERQQLCLQTIRGYRLEFKTKAPFLSLRKAATMEMSFKGEKEAIMDEKAEDLQAKNAIKPCHSKMAEKRETIRTCMADLLTHSSCAARKLM